MMHLSSLNGFCRHALDAEGRYVYTADRYKIHEGPVVLKKNENEAGGTLVYKGGNNNQQELLEKEDTKEFAPANRTGLQNAKDVAAILGHCGNFLRGLRGAVEVASSLCKLKI